MAWLLRSGKLIKVAVSGGGPQTICDMDAGLAQPGVPTTPLSLRTVRSGMSSCPATGGPPRTLTTPDRREARKEPPLAQVLPGGRAVVFTIIPADIGPDDNAQIAVLSLDTGRIRVLVDGGSNPWFLRTGHLLDIRSGSIIAVPFDPRRLEITGDSIRRRSQDIGGQRLHELQCVRHWVARLHSRRRAWERSARRVGRSPRTCRTPDG